MGAAIGNKILGVSFVNACLTEEYKDKRAAAKVKISVDSLKEKKYMATQMLHKREIELEKQKNFVKQLKQKGTDKVHLKSQFINLKQLTLSRNTIVGTISNLDSLLLKIEDTNLQSTVTEGYKEFINGMKSLVSEDNIKDLDNLINRLDESNQGLLDFNESMDNINNIMINDTMNNQKLVVDDDDFMDELDKLLNEEEPIQNTPKKKLKQEQKLIPLDDMEENNDYDLPNVSNTIIEEHKKEKDESNNKLLYDDF